MGRLRYIEYEDASSEVRDLYDSDVRITGRVTNFHKLLGHVPWLFRWYLPLQMSGHKAGVGLLDQRTRSLAHVTTALFHACSY